MIPYPHLHEALAYTAVVHADQRRKGGNTSYLGHLLGVAAIVIDEDGTEEQVVAALLHDAVEDQGGHARLEDIRRRYGDHVADMVFACSDAFVEPKPPWRQRKEDHIAHLSEGDEDVLLIVLADKLYNARSILLDLDKVGVQLWERFKASREETLWYYDEMYELLRKRLGDTRHGALVEELASVLDRIESR